MPMSENMILVLIAHSVVVLVAVISLIVITKTIKGYRQEVELLKKEQEVFMIKIAGLLDVAEKVNRNSKVVTYLGGQRLQ